MLDMLEILRKICSEKLLFGFFARFEEVIYRPITNTKCWAGIGVALDGELTIKLKTTCISLTLDIKLCMFLVLVYCLPLNKTL